jgi:hypothetical protein
VVRVLAYNSKGSGFGGKDNIKMDLTEIGWGDVEWIHLILIQKSELVNSGVCQGHFLHLCWQCRG